MAVCALASARARDGSLFSGRWNLAQLRDPPSETFYDAARHSIPFNLVTSRDHNCMRACAILALTNIQCGQIRLFHQNLARYHAIVAMDGLHDEANWPKDLGLVELEERRRLVRRDLFCNFRITCADQGCSSGRYIPWTFTRLLYGPVSYATGKLNATCFILQR